ncbi:MAG: acetyl-CoA carboxylase biotin carboxylase subunit [Halieaceae bacterium]|jgi:geranyl-CoA carboxylase alpha subunit|nr:acetyl-CoA carboxylase biotin carboxylase subunit [Halieaceae bacterium]
MMTRSFDSVLVANRGEIAVRILRSVRAAGYRAIAVYSQADAQAPHVALADEAVLLGPAPVRDSYLNSERILDAARRSGAQAIHPGYGFLSENAVFAAACEAAGLVFIGPSAQAIELMGNKAAAKRRMLEAGVPCVPGYQQANADDAALIAAAQEIGLPLMVKAAAGGGGRGMRLVTDFDALPAALEAARSEASNAFGSGELILEKAVQRPRHVEVQVFGDHGGELIHLGERDCSVQRRHQKVVEEAPCPVMTAELRRAMGDAAVAAARSIDYVGAGTVEFLLDESGNFYFLEMNTRLQVEHPVTECITGLDLVDLQLRVARGEPLGLRQEDVRLCGHAIEVRLYAEDADKDFLPATGRVERWLAPCGAGLRVDHGLCDGLEISPFYDPMLAKIVASGPDRETARRRLLRALNDTVLFGVTTNREFLIDVLGRDRFAAGEATTAFLAEEFTGAVSTVRSGAEDRALAAALQMRHLATAAAQARVSGSEAVLGMRRLPATFLYDVGDDEVLLQVTQLAADRFEVSCADAVTRVAVLSEGRKGLLRVDVDGIQYTVHVHFAGDAEVALQWRGRSFRFSNRLDIDRSAADAAASGAVLAPMHGNLLALRVSVGDRVERGDDVAVIEAMKMEHRLTAPASGVVAAVHGAEGDQIAAGAVVIEIEAES